MFQTAPENLLVKWVKSRGLRIQSGTRGFPLTLVLAYAVHGKPWYWPDRVRVMHRAGHDRLRQDHFPGATGS